MLHPGTILRDLDPYFTPYAVAFSPDSRTVAVANGDGGIRIWDAGR